MSDQQASGRRESRDERSHRIASQIIRQEQIERERKTARLRAKRLARQSSSDG